LLSQHKHFCAIHKEDQFALQYMNYLGHFEFGLNHKSWNSPVKFADPVSLNYWMEQWRLFYENLFSEFKSNGHVVFIAYKDLCENKKTSEKLCEKINLKSESRDFLFVLSEKKITEDFDLALLEQCEGLEEKLKSISIN
jgi:hypothetical protein